MDTRLTSNIAVTATDAGLSRTLGQFATQLSKLVDQMNAFARGLGKAEMSKTTLQQLKAMNQQMGILAQSGRTLSSVLNERQFGALSDQAMGRKVKQVGFLNRELKETTSMFDALNKRAEILNTKMATLARGGRSATKNTIGQALGFERAIADAKRLETELARLDRRSSRAGFSSNADIKALREQITGAQASLIQRVQNPRTRAETLQREMNSVDLLIGRYAELIATTARANSPAELRRGQREKQAAHAAELRRLDREEKALNDLAERKRKLREADRRADLARAQEANRTANRFLYASDAERQAALERGSRQFSFPQESIRTQDQLLAARGRLHGLTAEFEQANAKVLRGAAMLQRAMDMGAPTRSIERLNNVMAVLTRRQQEAFAAQRQLNQAIERSPQERGARIRQQINETMFGDGGLMFGGRIAGAMVLIGIISGVMNAIQNAARFTVDFEKNLAQLGAIAGATSGQMDSLKKSIEDVAANANYSTNEITTATTAIAQAGFSAGESGQILKDALNLAVGAGVSPKDAVDTLTSALGAFQLQATESTRIVDIMVSGLNRSKLTIEQLRLALQYAGATAQQAGVSFEELVTVASSLANAGIRSGSTIGTGMRQLMVDMQTPTEKFNKNLKDVGLTLADVDVKAKGFANVVKTLTEAGFSATAAYESFETRAAASFLAFRNQLDLYDDLSKEILASGAAADAQAKAMNTLAAQSTRLMNVLGELLSDAAEPFLDFLKVAASLTADFITQLNNLGDWVGEVTGAFEGLGQVLQGSVQGALIGLIWGGTRGGLIGAITGAFIGLVGALGDTRGELDEVQTALAESNEKFESQRDKVANVEAAIERLIERQGMLREGGAQLETELLTLNGRFEELNLTIGSNAKAYDDALDAMMRYRREQLKQLEADATLKASDAEVAMTKAQGVLGKQTGQITTARGTPRLYFPFLSNIPTIALQDRQGKTHNWHNWLRIAFTSIDADAVKVAIANLQKLEDNQVVQGVLPQARERLQTLTEIRANQAAMRSAQNQAGFARAAQRPSVQGGYQDYIRLRSGATAASDKMNETGSSRSATQVMNQAHAALLNIRAQIGRTSDPQEKRALESVATQMEGLIAEMRGDIRRNTEREEKENKPESLDKARKGFNMSGTQVKAELLKRLPGANIYSERPRSMALQRRLYADYLAGRGPLAAKPGTSFHAKGNAIDMAPIPGMSIDQVAAMVEDMGLEVTEVLVERNPRTGGVHWHIAWKPQSSQFAKRGAQLAGQRAAAAKKALEDLLEARAGSVVKTHQNNIDTLIQKARGGTDDPEKMRQELRREAEAWFNAQLAKWDLENPLVDSEGQPLNAHAMEARNLARNEFTEELKSKVENFVARFDNGVVDFAVKRLDMAWAEIELALERSLITDGVVRRAMESRSAIFGNRMNLGRQDAGTSYILQRDQNNAGILEQRNQVQSYMWAERNMQTEISAMRDGLTMMNPGSEAYNTQLQAITEKEKALLDIQEKRVTVQNRLNEATQKFVDLPLEERLKGAVAAWAENSGAMNDWQTILVNNVGPALDMLSGEFATLIENVMTGTRSITQALGDLLTAIGKFIVQLIAKALALMAVKWILSLFGLQLQNSPGGVVIGRTPDGKFNGGLIEKRFNGGPIQHLANGGRVFGKTTHDNVMTMTAGGEYVLRKKAVDSIGVDTLDRINKHGARGLNGGFMNIQAPRQETNVYVVKPDSMPPMGPNDVKVIIQDDILQGGVTKKLIKQVAQGG